MEEFVAGPTPEEVAAAAATTSRAASSIMHHNRFTETRHSYQSTAGTWGGLALFKSLRARGHQQQQRPQPAAISMPAHRPATAEEVPTVGSGSGGNTLQSSLACDLTDAAACRRLENSGCGNDAPGHGHHSQHGSDSTSFNQMALLYAIFLTLFGLVFPLSSYVRARPYSSWHLCVFYILLYSSAIGFLLFFMAWVMSRPSHKLFVENSDRSGELVRLQESEKPPQAATRVEFRIGRFSVSESSHNFGAGKEGQSLLDGKEARSSESDVVGSQQQQHAQPAASGTSNGQASRVELLDPERPGTAVAASAASLAGQGSSQMGVTFDVQSSHNNNSTQGSNNLDTIGRQKAYMKRINSTLIQNAKELGVHEIQAYSVLSLQESHSPSFFLRIACFIFGALKVTHEFLHIVDKLTEVGSGCTYGGKAAGELIQYALSIAFTVLQTFFIFKYSKVSVNIYQKVSVLGFMHLVATNMCVWFQAILLETGHNAQKYAVKKAALQPHPTPALAVNATGGEALAAVLSYGGAAGHHYATTQQTGGVGAEQHLAHHANCSKEVFWRMAPYLFPFTIEYSLMAAFSCYVLYCNVGKFLDVIQTKGFNVGKKCLRNRKRAQTSFSASCYKSDKGFFLGALQLIVGIVSGIYFTIYINDQPDDLIVGKYIYLSTDLALLLFNLLLCIVAYRQIRALTFVQRMSTGPDAWLLGITLAGVLAFELFQLFGAFAEQGGIFLALRLAQGVTCILQSLFQVFLVLDGEKRRSRTREAIEQKPGREMIAALLLGNLALWVVYTLEVREINGLPNYNDAYVLIASQIFSYVCSPLIIFFRFHSACCFVDIWRHAYKASLGGGHRQHQQLHDHHHGDDVECGGGGAGGKVVAGVASSNSLAVAREMSHM